MEKEEKAQRKFLSCNASEPTQEPVIPDLDEYFQNSSPIPHIFDREEQSSTGDDFKEGITLISPQSTDKKCSKEVLKEEAEEEKLWKKSISKCKNLISQDFCDEYKDRCDIDPKVRYACKKTCRLCNNSCYDALLNDLQCNTFKRKG
ncbi:unnamed protein product [Lepeophtheirus salmonis]|uniref:(salmon louse) hypothetical protein n=1 Tax=Lepeophtheirus salmonis TaxID=72036 RepID=A0A7R8H2A4_LEPSM|nr:unnamed protein product [Lepeophtheirus salmonis]CAF2825168.1 unnamed protein product [Lepeophtheirus salmonis]